MHLLAQREARRGRRRATAGCIRRAGHEHLLIPSDFVASSQQSLRLPPYLEERAIERPATGREAHEDRGRMAAAREKCPTRARGGIMTPRGLLTTIGATALGFGLIIGGAPAMPDVFAQEATTPAAEAPAQTEQQQKADFEAQRAQAYDSFVAALASELGSDEAAVDAAIRTALTQQVDERAAAGDIGVEQAAAMKAVIEVSQAPLFLGFGGHGMRGFDGHDRQGPGGRIGDDDR